MQGASSRQYDFTREQYRALAQLTATLCTTLPKIQPDFPRQRATLGPVVNEPHPAATHPATRGELLKDAPPAGSPTTRPDALASTDQPGQLIPHTLSPGQYATFQGVVGHYHVQTNKDDPGPAFQWQPLMLEVRKLMSPEAKAACEAMRGHPAPTFLLPVRAE